MSQITPRTSSSRSIQARVEISPATTATPVLTRVSQATRGGGSRASRASSTASEIWSATLSGWPSETDSEVNRCRSGIEKLYAIGDNVLFPPEGRDAESSRHSQCRPGPQHGCRAARQFGASRHADGHGRHLRGDVEGALET